MSATTITVDPILGPVKPCSRCKEVWPADREFFHRRRNGWQSWCRACWHEYVMEGERGEARRAYQRAWRARSC